MSKELLEAVKLFISQPLNNPLSRGQIMEVARIALPILEQEEQGEGEWIEWGGGSRPVGYLDNVEVLMSSGSIRCRDAGYWSWQHTGSTADIIAYRIIPERATNQNGEQ